MTTILGVKTTGGATGLYEVNGSTCTLIAAGGTSEVITGFAAYEQNFNRGVQFGPNEVYFWIGDQILKWNGTTVSTAHTLSPTLPPSIQTVHSGLYILDNNGTPTLAGFYHSANGNDWYGITSTNGSSWTTQGPFAMASGYPRAEILFQNKLYIASSDGSQAVAQILYDPIFGTAVEAFQVGFNSHSADFCIAKGQLYRMGFHDLNTNLSSYKFYKLLGGGTWQDLGDLFYDINNADSGAGRRPILFRGPDGNLYAMFWVNVSGTDRGFKMIQIILNGDGSSATFNDVSNPVIPAGLRYPSFPDNTFDSCRLNCYVDHETSPNGGLAGTRPLIWLNRDYTGYGFVQYRFINASTELLAESSGGGDGTIALPNVKHGGGEYVYLSGGDYFTKILTRQKAANGVRITYKTEGPLGNESVSASFYYSTDGGIATNRCTLFDPSVGTLSDSNRQIDGITANGALRQVTWLAQTDGVPKGATIRLEGRAF